MSTTPPTQLAYRPDIDGLRAIAVLSVVLYHADLGLPGGYVGVDVFFVISGFLITSLILKDLRREAFSLVEFWERRIRRIAPALIVVTAATLIAGWFILLPPAFDRLGTSIIALVLMVSNFHFANVGDYFGPAAHEMPLLHTWSLAVEEQFYLLLPLALMVMGKTRWKDRPAAIVTAGWVASFVMAVVWVQASPNSSFYELPTRIWELLTGSLLALAPQVRSSTLREFMGALALPLLLAPCFLYDNNTPFPGLGAVPPVLGAALVIASGMTEKRAPFVNRALSCRSMVFVGLISYSLYLWHWPLLALTRAATPVEPSVPLRLVMVAASFVLAILSWRFVELPFRTRKLLPVRGGLMAGAAIAAVVLLVAGIAMDRLGGFRHRVPAESLAYLDTGRNVPRFQRKIPPEEIPDGLTRLGPSGEPHVLIWGDSHAMCLLPGIDALCQEYNVSACAATYSSTIPVLDYEFRIGAVVQNGPFNDAVFRYLQTSRISSVVLVGRWAGYGHDPAFPPALVKTVERVRALGPRVFVVSDVPEYRCKVPETLAYHAWRGEDPARIARFRKDYQSENATYLGLLPSLRGAGAVVLDPAAPLDAANSGLPFVDGRSLYTDAQHLSTDGAMTVRSAFEPMFETLSGAR